MKNKYLAALLSAKKKPIACPPGIIDSNVYNNLKTWGGTAETSPTGSHIYQLRTELVGGTGNISSSNSNGQYYLKTSNTSTTGKLYVTVNVHPEPKEIAKIIAKIYNGEEIEATYEDGQYYFPITNKTPIGGTIQAYIWP